MIDYEFGKRLKYQRKKLHIKTTEFAVWLKVDRDTIRNYENGTTTPRGLVLEKINRFLEMKSKEELTDDVLKDDYGMEYEKISDREYSIKIPRITIQDYKDFIQSFECGKSKLSLIFDEINSGFYLAFEVKEEVKNNNNNQSLNVGDIAIAREVDIDELKKDIEPTEIWILILENDILFRKIGGYSKKENKVEIKALNPSFDKMDLSLNISEIKRLFQVKQRITKIQ